MIGSPSESSSDYLWKLDVLVPKTDEACNKLNSEQKTLCAEGINTILMEVFENLGNFDGEQSTNLRNICTLAEKAWKMHLLSGEGSTIVLKIKASPNLLDFTIQTREGEVKVNSALLKEKSVFFNNMFEGGMEESVNKRVKLDKYSSETIEFLMRVLHAPPTSEITLPPDNALVLELIDLAITHEFGELIVKLGPAVTTFIRQQRPTVVENLGDWLKHLAPHAAHLKANTAASAAFSPIVVATAQFAADQIAEITPHVLNHYDIPLTPPKTPGGAYKIPIDFVNLLLKEETRDHFRSLPVMLDIKSEDDLSTFIEACFGPRIDAPLPLKLACSYTLSKEREMSVCGFAKDHNIELTFDKVSIPPGTAFFGKEQWETFFGTIGEVPPLPANIHEILSAPCPFNPANPDITVKDTHMLVLIPATVNDKPLTLKTLGELVQNPLEGGHSTKYEYIDQSILDAYGDLPAPEGSHWALMTKDVIPGSRNKSYTDQKALVEAPSNYEVPDLLSMAVGIAVHHVQTGTRLFSDNPWTYTRCKETVGAGSYQTVVGGFAPAGFNVNCNPVFDLVFTGVAGLRKFF